MAESSKLRLVRCPKCENLLSELPDYSVYQCGGCGAVLRAKKGSLEGGNGSQRSDEERIGAVSDKSDNFSGKSENLVEKVTVSGIENGEGRVSDSEGSSETVAEGFGNDLKSEVGKWVVEDDNSNTNELVNEILDSKIDKLETRVENANGSRRSARVFERKLSDKSEEEQFGRIKRGFERVRFSSSSQVGEGTSKYNLDSSYRNEPSRAMRPEYVDTDREELLRKLDELKDQLCRIQNVNDKPRVEPYAETGDYGRNHTSSFNRVSRQFSAPNKHVAGPPCYEHFRDPFPMINRSDTGIHDYQSSMQNSLHVPRYEDSFEPQMFRRPPLYPPRRIASHPQYMSPDPDSFDPHAYNNMSLHHHVSCSCYQCYDRQPPPHVPLQLPSSSLGNRRFPHVVNKAPYHHELHTPYGTSHGYNNNPRVVNNTPSLGKWQSDHNPEMSARTQRVVLANGHRCLPVAGGAPFITCHNCFELLKLPKRVFSKKGEWKMSCGACSSVNSFAIEDEKLVSIDTSLKQTTTEALNGSNDVGPGPGPGPGRVYMKRDNASFCSEDYANSVYDFQAMDREPVSSFKAEETHNLNLHSVSATTSEDERFSDDLFAKQGVTSTDEQPEKRATSSSPPGSPPQDPFDYNSKYRAVNRCGKGNLSSRSDQERVMMNKSTMRQNSLKESLATEMEISLNDYANTGVSQDTGDVCREDEQPKGKKGVDSFLAGIIKKSFRDFSRSNQTMESGKRNVTVNGHLIPDRLVKKAEKLAGPVYPGQYWYDYRAGFWGVMGGPCLGIVPPYIEEFNHPIPENCAGGNTGVFVNGRELNQKDMELLTTRGLPAAKGRSYIIDISGRVVDEDSGQELDSLGKLAPTVEKVKHGFGMRVPKKAA